VNVRLPTTLVLVLLALQLAGCEGLFTGSRESSQPLTQMEDGNFAPVKLTLSPEMNPIALNLHAHTVANQLEIQRWNTYRATLTLAGAPVASGTFHVNNPGSGNSAQGGPFSLTMLYASVPQAGEYELTVALAKPKEITVDSPRLEVRRNTQPPVK